MTRWLVWLNDVQLMRYLMISQWCLVKDIHRFRTSKFNIILLTNRKSWLLTPEFKYPWYYPSAKHHARHMPIPMVSLKRSGVSFLWFRWGSDVSLPKSWRSVHWIYRGGRFPREDVVKHGWTGGFAMLGHDFCVVDPCWSRAFFFWVMTHTLHWYICQHLRSSQWPSSASVNFAALEWWSTVDLEICWPLTVDCSMIKHYKKMIKHLAADHDQLIIARNQHGKLELQL